MADTIVTNEVKQDVPIVQSEQPLVSDPQLIGNIQAGGNAVRIGTLDNVQAAIDAMSAAGGGTVYLKSGRYILHQGLVMKDNVNIQGESRENSILDFINATSDPGISIIGDSKFNLTNNASSADATNGSTSIVIQGSSGLGDAIVAAIEAGDDILLDYEQLYEIASVTKDSDTQATITLVHQYVGNALTNVDYYIANYIRNIAINNLTIVPTSGGQSVHIDYAEKYIVRDVNVIENGSATDFDVTRSIEAVIEDIDLVNSTVTIFASGNNRFRNISTDRKPFNLDQARHISVDHISVRNSSTASGITISSSCRNCLVTDYYSDANFRGLTLNGEHNTVIGGTIKNSLRDGVSIAATAVECSILGLASVDNGSAVGAWYGVVVTAGASRCSIVGCQLLGNDTGAINDAGTGTVSSGNQT